MNKENIFKSNNRIAIFDYLKAIAIILVIINHYVHTSCPSFRSNIIFPMIIKMPVPIFMIVSGCMLSMSFDKRFNKLSEMYHYRELTTRILRFWITFFFAFVVEVAFSVILLQYTIKPIGLIKDFLVGGPGENGSYYVPVLIQLVFIFPLIFTLIRKFNTKGLLICLVVNLAYETICTATDISAELYRLLMPRYITYVALGGWFYFNNYRISLTKYAAMFIIGLTFILMLQLGYKPFILKKWTDTCMIIAMYIFPIVAFLISKYKAPWENTYIYAVSWKCIISYFSCTDAILQYV